MIDIAAIGIILLAIAHPGLLWVFLPIAALFSILAGVAWLCDGPLLDRRLRRDAEHRARLWKIIEEDNARPIP